MNQLVVKTALLLTLTSSIALAQNPLNFGSNIKTADPSGHIWADGKMYLYTSHDEECQQDFHMKDWHTFSSSDLLNWTDHGPSLSVDDLTWADDFAWAPDAAYKNGKYYLIFPAGTGFKDRVNPEKAPSGWGLELPSVILLQVLLKTPSARRYGRSPTPMIPAYLSIITAKPIFIFTA